MGIFCGMGYDWRNQHQLFVVGLSWPKKSQMTFGTKWGGSHLVAQNPLIMGYIPYYIYMG
jgi:hypothetical protein